MSEDNNEEEGCGITLMETVILALATAFLLFALIVALAPK